MRISDWSSDVCSSDLHDGHTDIDDPEAIELQRLACVHSPRLPHRNNPTKAPFGAFFMPGGYMADIFHWSSSASSNTTVDGRTEEHTSELPSLMRTSHAVSCLTKKLTPQS